MYCMNFDQSDTRKPQSDASGDQENVEESEEPTELVSVLV